MAIQRTLRDVHALCLHQMPFQDEDYTAGDEVVILRRRDRLEEHGWIRDAEEEEQGRFRAELSEVGAAIINHFARHWDDNTIDEELDRGIGDFVDDAIEQSAVISDDWDVVAVDDDRVIIRSGDETREYRAAA